jgi:hypothetical protein
MTLGAKITSRIRYSWSNRLAIALIFAVLSILAMLAGCGGGTTGTGGSGSDDFAGKILSLSGAPIALATVTVEETGDSTLTDANGDFTIQTTSAPPEKATLLVETATAQGSAVVADLPDVPSVVEVSLQLNEKNNSLAVTSKKVTPKKKHPTPKPSVIPTPVPSEVPTPATTPTPFTTSTAEITPTSTPPEASPTPTDSPTVSPSASPIASVTPSPVPALAIFRGVINASDPALLADAKIGLVGQGRRFQIASDGKFAFKASAATGATLAIRSGNLFTRAILDGVTEQAQKIIISGNLNLSGNGRLELTINSVRIITASANPPNVGPLTDEIQP